MADFSPVITGVAIIRQSRNDANGVRCAGCGRVESEFGRYRVVARIPFAKGGHKTAENCILLCEDGCFPKIAGDKTREIPFCEIPYYKASPLSGE